MMISLRLSVPPDLMPQVRRLLAEDPRVTNLVVLPNGSVRPAGDAVFADVTREAAGAVVGRLEDLGVGERGAISIAELAGSPYRAADEADRAAPGNPEDGVIWRLVEDKGQSGSRASVSTFALMSIAITLAAIAVINDSPILVVGAMVVSPEYAAVAAASIGMVLRDWSMVLRAVRLLATLFLVAIAVVVLLALLARLPGMVTPQLVTRARPQTGFIWHPDRWSFVVAVVAGIAGTLSLTQDRASALVGVFISVTTVPAAGNLALGLAVWAPHEIVGSLEQLLLNLAGMVVAGWLTLLVQRRLLRVSLPGRRGGRAPAGRASTRIG